MVALLKMPSRASLSLLAALLLPLVRAQCDSSVLLTSQDDADNISSCSTFSGDINIDPSYSGTLNLDGIQTVKGSIVGFGPSASITGFSSNSLKNVTGNLTLSTLSLFTSVSIPALTTAGSIYFNFLPKLSSTKFTTSMISASIIEFYGTGVTNLDGFNANGSATSLYVSGNPSLGSANIATQQIGSLWFWDNKESLAVSMPNFTIAANDVYFENLTSVQVPVLKTIHGGLQINSNFFDNITIPELSTIGGSLVISENQLTSVDFPVLTDIGANFEVSDNSQWSTIDGFVSLKNILGSIGIEGDFTSLALPDLISVDQDFSIETSEVYNCGQFGSKPNGLIISGSYSCTAKSPSSTGITSTGTGSPIATNTGSATVTPGAAQTSTGPNQSSGGGGGLSSGAKIGIAVGIAIPVLLALVGGIFCVGKRNKQKKEEAAAASAAAAAPPPPMSHPGPAATPMTAYTPYQQQQQYQQYPQHEYYNKVELPESTVPSELHSNSTPSEPRQIYEVQGD